MNFMLNVIIIAMGSITDAIKQLRQESKYLHDTFTYSSKQWMNHVS